MGERMMIRMSGTTVKLGTRLHGKGVGVALRKAEQRHATHQRLCRRDAGGKVPGDTCGKRLSRLDGADWAVRVPGMLRSTDPTRKDIVRKETALVTTSL